MEEMILAEFDFSDNRDLFDGLESTTPDLFDEEDITAIKDYVYSSV